MVTLLDPKNDYVFKRLFAGDPELTLALINDLRPDLPQVTSVEILNPAIDASELGGKGIVLDVRARCIDGHQYNVEMQVQRQLDWGARSMFYLARLLSQQLDAGEAYRSVASAIGIHLLDFDLFVAGEAERSQALWRFEMRDATQPDVTLGSELQLTVIELKKADRLGQLQGPASDWVRFFEHWREDRVMADVTHEPVKKAMGSIRQLSADEEAQRLAEAREWGRINWNLSMGSARREGLEQGREQGLEQGREQGLEQGREQGMEQGREQGLEQGREQGLEQGREQGLEQGRMEALRNTLAQLLKQRFGPLPDWAADDLAAASADQLAAWTGSVLSARSLEELFARPG